MSTKLLPFSFATATQILFGNGVLGDTLKTAKSLGVLGKRALVITGAKKDRAAPLLESLKKEKISHVLYSVSEEPTTDDADRGATLARDEKADFVIGFGGGSVLDTGKAIAMLASNGGVALDYMEVIGKSLPITKPSLPYIAITTTSGTGAEVTKNAVLKSEKHQQKASLRSPFMFPALAVIDPKLTLSVPPSVTASTGLDAFTQCLEPYVSCSSNPLTDAIALQGLFYGARSLRRAYTHGSDLDARSDMALCSLFGGLALANAKLGTVHGLAGVLGGLIPGPHGAICAILLPEVILANVKALKERDPKGPYLEKFTRAARVVCGRDDATPNDLASWVSETCKLLNVPLLSKYGLQEKHFDEVVRKSIDASSTKGNPIKLTSTELLSIVKKATLPPSKL